MRTSDRVGPIRDYRIDVPEEDLEDLRERLRRWRHPNQVEGAGWAQGISLDYLQSVVRYWLEVYDWRVYESALTSARAIFPRAVRGKVSTKRNSLGTL